MRYPLYDAHAHLGSKVEQEIRKNYSIGTLMNASTPEEYERAKQLASESAYIIPTFGVHPWSADKINVADCIACLKDVEIIGEIGMDSVWCEVPLEKQEEVFKQQLELAERWGKPIILHTKGEEARIAELIQPYTMPILIHWYADEKYLEAYNQKNCYFTIGPDFQTSTVTWQIAKLIPLERLFVETDGISAVEWALDREVECEELPHLLEAGMQWLADLKGITLEKVASQMVKNMRSFRNQ